MEMIPGVIGLNSLGPATAITITGDIVMRTSTGADPGIPGGEKERGRPSQTDDHDHDRRDPSAAQGGNDNWDDRNKTGSSGSRYSSTHHCIDSVLKQQPLGTGAISPSPTPPSSQTTRLPPPGTEQHYTSHCCHDPSHLIDSPFRSTTPHSSSTTHHRSRRRRSPLPSHDHQPPKPVILPYAARPLSRWDFAAFEPLLAHYLERHKRTNIADLDEESVRDRWKAFVAKWNAVELEKAWYEPEMFLRVVRMRAAAAEEARVRTAVDAPSDGIVMTPPPTGASYASGMGESVSVDGVMTGYTAGTVTESQKEEDDDDEEDEYAPPLPPSSTSQPSQPSSLTTTTTTAKPGPTIPSLQDLELRRTFESESRASSLAAHRLLRRADRAVAKSRLDDILPPRAEPGTRERQLEMKRLVTESNREFAAEREVGGDVEVEEKELLGEAGEDEYKRMLERMRNRKSEREVRREEESRAKGVEREERIREGRAREEEKLGVLREMARQRFG
ncbi:hypothetical protein GE09DRAFT_1225211 [Coniochaeta sp. 2T2.1]|nr:hypothetical protein GE09DRAFT_1225211 [Coniochaeta sp. 2T2.1]